MAICFFKVASSSRVLASSRYVIIHKYTDSDTVSFVREFDSHLADYLSLNVCMESIDKNMIM